MARPRHNRSHFTSTQTRYCVGLISQRRSSPHAVHCWPCLSHTDTSLQFHKLFHRTRKPIANAKVSARQPWYVGRNSLNRPSLRNAQQNQRHIRRFEVLPARKNSVADNAGLSSFVSRCCLSNMRASAKFRENSDL